MPIAFMGHVGGAVGVEDEAMRPGNTPVRAKLFAHVAGILLVTGAARPAVASLTASYEGAMTVLGTPGTAAVAAALAQVEGHVSGSVTLALADPSAAGVYVLTGRVRGRRFLLRGTNGQGAELRWRGRLTSDRGVRGPVRITLRRARMAGMLALSRKGTAGSCGSSCFAGLATPVVLPVYSRCHVPGGLAL